MRPEVSQLDMSVAVCDKQFGSDDDEASKRPAFMHQETDWILSYYQQAGTESEADNDEPSRDGNLWPGGRRASTPSTTSSGSGSAYSSDGDEPPPSSSATKPKLNEYNRERAEEDLTSTPSPANHKREDGERRNAGRRPTELSADRRRIVVMELSPVLPLSARRGQRPNVITTTPSSDQPRCNTRLARKSSGIALIAPPDASPAAYTNLTPPSSAPAHISSIPNSISASFEGSFYHKRSVSDLVDLPRKGSRDIGIVGQLDETTPSIRRKATSDIRSYFDIQGSKVPVFQTPHRSPMPSPIPESVTVALPHPGQLTPEIGEAKDIHKPVVGPVVVDVSGAVRDGTGSLLTPSFSPSVPSSYLHYQPGVHSVAGPPPPLITRPNRGDKVGLMSPPPRPPRMRTPTTSSSSTNSNPKDPKDRSPPSQPAEPPQLLPMTSGESTSAHDRDPSQVTVRLFSGDSNEIGVESPPPAKSFHTREGAFPPSATGSLSPTLPPELALESSVSSIISSSTSYESIPPPTPQKDDPLPVPARSSSRSSTSTSRSSPPHPPRSRPVSMHNKLTELPDVPPSSSWSPVVNERSLPSPGMGALKAKRFSALPHTPPVLSSSSLSYGSPRTPSPLLPPVPKRRKRIIEQWPASMQYKDVLECKTPLERSLGYARKINELAMYDCGLTEWMDAVKTRALPKKSLGHKRSKPSVNHGRHMPSSYKEPPEGRRVSRDSFESGATFPMRPDAYTATDLSTRMNDLPVRMEDLVTKAPTLPYPSLAPMTRSSTNNSTVTSPPSSMRSLPIPLPLSASKSTGGFFSSIGRKTSIKKDKRPPSPGKTVKRTGTTPQQKPDPLPLNSTPHIIGGPRAIPGRSYSTLAQPVARPEETKKQVDHKRRSTISGKRPSLFPSSNKPAPPPPTNHTNNAHHASMPPYVHKQAKIPEKFELPEEQFNVQLDKLVHLLPHADRNVLAGYLKRSGQDILAVGKYLEDEKNGTIVYR